MTTSTDDRIRLDLLDAADKVRQAAKEVERIEQALVSPFTSVEDMVSCAAQRNDAISHLANMCEEAKGIWMPSE